VCCPVVSGKLGFFDDYPEVVSLRDDARFAL
jgi:hypothetical protein